MKENRFYSLFGYDDTVIFRPLPRHLHSFGIPDQEIYGIVAAIKFTKTGTFYDITSPNFRVVFEGVPSDNVRPIDFVQSEPEPQKGCTWEEWFEFCKWKKDRHDNTKQDHTYGSY